MDVSKLTSAVADIMAESDPTLKSLKLASICTALWAESGVQLVVVGGSAIEFLTEGAYASGDLDLCSLSAATLPVRQRQEVMGLLGAKGGPRNYHVGGMYIDVLGPVESFATTPFRKVKAPYGEVLIMKPEDLLVERVLISVSPQADPEARDCARKLAAVSLKGVVPVDWNEVRRVANLPEYRNFTECSKLLKEVADELRIASPLHPD